MRSSPDAISPEHNRTRPDPIPAPCPGHAVSLRALCAPGKYVINSMYFTCILREHGPSGADYRTKLVRHHYCCFQCARAPHDVSFYCALMIRFLNRVSTPKRIQRRYECIHVCVCVCVFRTRITNGRRRWSGRERGKKIVYNGRPGTAFDRAEYDATMTTRIG